MGLLDTSFLLAGVTLGVVALSVASQKLGRDLRRGLPFLIAGALLIEVFLGYRLVSSIRAVDPAFEKDGLVGGSYRDRETAL